MASHSVTGRPRALVTGASAGIGAAFAEQLARAGHDLLLVARRRDRLNALAHRLSSEAGIKAEVVCADLTDHKAVSEVEARIANDGALTTLVNNAGFGGYQPFASIAPKVIDDLVAIHIRTVARLTRAALPGMIERGRGTIINVASLLALSGTLPPVPLPHRATYAGAKAFMLAFTQALAGELVGTGVRLQVCLPGRVATEFHSVQGIDTSKLPPTMTADDVVRASLASLTQSEIVCVPALGDAALLSRLAEAEVAVLQAAVWHPVLAERYRSATSKG
ncbi:MAG: SDR family NAD(P)-dependent oxidoreductase [Hyphomicrobiales bacterium]|nr:SDR family NAD(P)-dependent oxidoreductase [Hyphomicrobiales bacterium]